MTEKNVTLEKILTPEFRVSFERILKPSLTYKASKSPMPSGGYTPDSYEYSLVMLIPKTADVSKIKKAWEAAVLSKWPDPDSRDGLRRLFKDGDKGKYESSKGCIELRASSRSMVSLIDSDGRWLINGTTGQILCTNRDFYSGCYAKAMINLKPWKEGVGVGVYLQSLMKTRDGEPFGSEASDPHEDFNVAPDASANDPKNYQTDAGADKTKDPWDDDDSF